tara:strand:+ start:6107 stop:6928 length:822 start_codon:yes stop_codon:yes gene_type:complete
VKKLDSFYVVPGYTFFYWGFTLPKRYYQDFINHFDLDNGKQQHSIKITINNKKYDAKVRLVKQDNKWSKRDVVQIFYDREYDTLKALRKLLIFSYAATIDKTKPKLKEILELIHVKDSIFRFKIISKQETDFDSMLRFMEDKNLFAFWKNKDKKKKIDIFLDYSRKWHDVKDVVKFKNRSNIIYLLHHSIDKTVYIGKANHFGSRIKKGEGRIGLDKNWDKFMYFELNPDYSYLLEDIETFAIRFMASVMTNDVKVKSLIDTKLKLVNKQLKH